MVYTWFWWRGSTCNQAHIFCRRFLLVSWSFCLSQETVVTMKDFSALLDMRRYKNWAHKISSWEHLTIWGPVLPVFPEHRVPYFCSPPWTSSGACWRSVAAAAHDLILVEIDGKHPCQVPICSWQTLSLSRPQFLHLSNGNINRLYLIGVVVGFKQEKASKMLTPSEGLSY